MKKIYLLLAFYCAVFVGFAQLRLVNPSTISMPLNAKSPLQIRKPIKNISASRSSIVKNVTLDYDSFDRKWAGQNPGFAQSASLWSINKNFFNNQNLTLRNGLQLFDTIVDVYNNTSYPITGTTTQIRVDSFVTYLGVANASGFNDTLVLSLFNISSIGVTGSGPAAVLSTTPLWADTFVLNTPLSNGFYSFKPNVTLPAGATFGIRYDFKGDTADHLTVAASYIEQCADTVGADTSKLGAFKALYYVNYTAGATNLSGINSIGFGTPTCGELWIQDWWIFPDISLITNCGTLSATKVDATCSLSNGSASATVSANSGTSTYKWSSGETTAAISGKPAGTYKVVRTSSLGCIDSTTVVIANVGTAPTFTMDSTNATCGNSNGTASALGAPVGSTYLWSNGATTTTISSLAPGTYTVSVNNAGCIASKSVKIGNTGAFTPQVSSTNTSCALNNGTATVTSPTGGTYVWSNGQTGASISALAAGSYTVTVTSSAGCTATASVSISSSTGISASTAVTNANCGATDGSAILTVTPTGTYTYSWSNGQSSKNLTAVGSGSYTVTVTATGGCTATAVANINNTGGPTLSVSGTNPVCFGLSTGSATASAAGGTGTLTYTWSNGGTTSSISSLPAGTYTVTVKDGANCKAISSYTVVAPAQINANASSSGVSCFGGTNGTASVVASGGTGTLSYTWSNAVTTVSLSNIAAGTYTVTVKDANNCTVSATTTVSTPAQINASATSTAIKCFGNTDGTATVSATGGTGSLSYTWSSTPTQNSATASGLVAGTYTVTVKDANLCSATASTLVSQPASALTATTSQTGNSATATPAGGTTPYSYSWNTTPAQNTATATGLTTGSYSVTVSDANGCSTTKTVVITSIANPQAIGLSYVRVYPNPSNGLFTLKAEMTEASSLLVSIIDVTGKVVFTENFGSTTKIEKQIDVKGIASGIYSIRFTTNQGVRTEKLIIE